MKTAAIFASSRPMIRIALVTATLLLLWLLFSAYNLKAANDPITCESPAQDPDTALLQGYVGHQYVLHSDRLYLPAENEQGYDLVPLWQQEEVTVRAVETVPGKGLRFHVFTQSGVKGYFEVDHLQQVSMFLGPAPIQVSAAL